MSLSRMTVSEYVEYRWNKGNEITPQAISKAIRKGHKVQGMHRFEKIGNLYIMQINKEELDQFLVSIKKPIKLRRK